MILDANGRIVVAGTALSSDSTYSSFAVACYDPGTSSLSVEMAYDPPVLRMEVPDQTISITQPSNTAQLTLPTLGMFAVTPTATNLSYTIDWGDGTTPDTPTSAPAYPVNTLFQGGGSTSALLAGSFGGQHTYNSQASIA